MSGQIEVRDRMKVTFEELSFAQTIVDPSCQRPRDERKIKKMVDEFEPEALGQITVSRRIKDDGTVVNVVLDGQHRGIVTELAGWSGRLRAKVYHGLTRIEEARLFRLLNNTSKVGRIALFNVAVTEEDPVCVAINKILHEQGLKASYGGGFAAIATAEKICRRPDGVEAFRWALKMCVNVWGTKSSALDGRIIEALAMLRIRYGTMIDTEAFRKKLDGIGGGIADIIGRARTFQQVEGGQIQTNIAKVMVTEYNKYIKKHKLPEWGTR